MTTILGNIAFGTNGSDNNSNAAGPVEDNNLSHTVLGFDGYDLIYAEGGNDTVYGGNDDDWIYGGNGSDTIYGGTGNDLLDGGSGANKLFGEAGDDWLDASDGTGTYDGGAGFDTIDYGDRATGGVNVDLVAGTASGGDRVLHIEKVLGTEFIDLLRGDGAFNRLEGLGGTDLLYGGGGNDGGCYFPAPATVSVPRVAQ
jgi:Ca2+-binding RTX toxin-like protein